MRRRDFLTWFRAAPLAAPFVVASAVLARPEDETTLKLGGKKVLELMGNGDLVLGATGAIVISTPAYSTFTILAPPQPWPEYDENGVRFQWD